MGHKHKDHTAKNLQMILKITAFQRNCFKGRVSPLDTSVSEVQNEMCYILLLVANSLSNIFTPAFAIK